MNRRLLRTIAVLFMLCTGGASAVAQESGPVGAKGLPAAEGRTIAPNDFGSGSFILPIPAAAFRPTCSGLSYDVDYRGYMYLSAAVPVSCAYPATFWAPVQLPSGDLITKLGLYYLDMDVNNDVTATLRAFCDFLGVSDVGSVTSSGSGGTGYLSTGLSYTVYNNMSANYSGCLLAVIVTLPSLVQTNLVSFEGVEIWYQRQIVPPPNTATFNDVPTNHPFFKFIEALYAAGITGGCNVSPPLYCPNDPITRGQMAVFLSVALGLWPYP